MSGRNKLAVSAYDGLFQNVVRLLEDARGSTARAVNTIMTATYWEIGRRIVVQEQRGKTRAGYGEALIEKLAGDLTARFGRGCSRRNIFQMREFYLAWPIVQTVSAQLNDGSNRSASLGGKPGRLSDSPAKPKLQTVSAKSPRHIPPAYP